MAVIIDDPAVAQLARELADAMGVSIDEAVVEALREQLARTTRKDRPANLVADLRAISDRSSALPDLDTRSAGEIIGYDEHGIPAAGKHW